MDKSLSLEPRVAPLAAWWLEKINKDIFPQMVVKTLPETNSKFAPENRPKLPQKERIVLVFHGDEFKKSHQQNKSKITTPT